MSVVAGERRIVSVLIADVGGSTTIAEKLGPERSKFLFDDIVRLMREEVERFGGTVAQLTGDGILALFGAPVAHEDDSERAVRATFAIREALDDYAAGVAPAYGVEIGARVAVNTGDSGHLSAGAMPIPDISFLRPTGQHEGHSGDLVTRRSCNRSFPRSAGCGG
jgi:class 3 adenylate cyclase